SFPPSVSSLCRLVSLFTCTDEIMQQEIRPLVAVDIIEQLHRQFAILSGGRGKDGAPIITFPEYAGFSDIPDEDFLNVVTYLTSIPSENPGFTGLTVYSFTLEASLILPVMYYMLQISLSNESVCPVHFCDMGGRDSPV
uniref:MCF2L n=1 Tax=Chelonoidis abingdonii TaxID=106734 RepID=A0A8C0H7F1_CHEAB